MPEDDFYSDGAGGGPEADNSAKEAPGDDDGETALLPKSILAGKEFHPGDEVVLRIVEMYEDQVAVQYAPAKEGDGDDYEKPSDAPQEAPDEMASMMG